MRKGTISHKTLKFDHFQATSTQRYQGLFLVYKYPSLLLKKFNIRLLPKMVRLQSESQFLPHVILVIATPIQDVGVAQNFSECSPIIGESPYLISRL